MSNPVIVIPQNIRNKIQFIVDTCDLEVSGLGTVVFDKEYNGYRVTSMCLLEQEVGAAHTDLDDDLVAQAVYESRNEEGELAFWWHSHVNMSVFWSGTDHKTMDDIGKNGLCVAIVFNKKEEMRGAIVMAPEGMPQIKFDDVDIITEVSYDFDVENLAKEIKEKVKPKTYKTYAPIVHSNYKTETKEDILELRAMRKDALDQWSRLTKLQKAEYKDFEEYFEDCCWSAHYGKSLYGADNDTTAQPFLYNNHGMM